MNAVGKILVFMNLVFSFIVGSFAVMTYIAGTNHADQNKKLHQLVTSQKSAAEVWRGEAERLQKRMSEMESAIVQNAPKGTIDDKADAGKIGEKVASVLKRVQGDLDALKKQKDDMAKDLDLSRATAKQAETATTIMSANQTRKEEENKKLRQILDDETKRTIELTKEKNELRDQYIAASVLSRSLTTRNTQLEEELQRMAKEMLRTQNKSKVNGSGSNPPPENVEGLISRVDPGKNLVSLTIGSDAGLQKGHTMYVFGLAAGASGGYRGQVKLIEVSAKSAVGEVQGKLNRPILQGDTVASSILGKR